LVGGATEVLGKFLHGAQVGLSSTLGVITTLEFLQHHFSLLGHRDLLVTQRIAPFTLLLSLTAYAQRPPRQRLSSNGFGGSPAFAPNGSPIIGTLALRSSDPHPDHAVVF
jgi:hypothetical protein